MRKIMLLVAIAFFTISNAQENQKVDFKRNELKINALSSIFGFPEFTYERVINEESSFGVSVGFAIDDIIETNFTLSPYYRYFFGKKPASGFFAEGFGMLNNSSLEYYVNSFDPAIPSYYEKENITDFALGFGLGGKWVTSKGFLFEINAGVGRNLLNSTKNDNYNTKFVGKLGVTTGYRF